MADETIHICCASDKNFVMPLTVMLLSLSENLDQARKTVIHIMDGRMREADREMVSKTVTAKNVEIRFIEIQNHDFFKGAVVSGHVSIATYYRLLPPSIIGPDIGKIIYLDSDLIVNTDIGKLWDIPFGGNYLLAAQEQGKDSLCVSSGLGLSNYRELGLNATDKYFNAGVLVMDLLKWREEGISQKVVDYVRHHKEHVRWWDQDGLNVMLAHKWGELDPRWNLSTKILQNPVWDDGPVKDPEKYQELIHHPYIVHFNTPVKPWHVGCDHPHTGLFLTYLRKTPYWPLAVILRYVGPLKRYLTHIIPGSVKKIIRKVLPKRR